MKFLFEGPDGPGVVATACGILLLLALVLVRRRRASSNPADILLQISILVSDLLSTALAACVVLLAEAKVVLHFLVSAALPVVVHYGRLTVSTTSVFCVNVFCPFMQTQWHRCRECHNCRSYEGSTNETLRLDFNHVLRLTGVSIQAFVSAIQHVIGKIILCFLNLLLKVLSDAPVESRDMGSDLGTERDKQKNEWGVHEGHSRININH